MQECEETIPCDFPHEKSLGSCSPGNEKMPIASQADQEQSLPSTSNCVQISPTNTPIRSVSPDSKAMEFELAKIKDASATREKLKKERIEIRDLLDENQTKITDEDTINELKNRKRELRRQLKENKRDLTDQVEVFKRKFGNQTKNQTLNQILDQILDQKLDSMLEKSRITNSMLVVLNRKTNKILKLGREREIQTKMEKLESRIDRLERTIDSVMQTNRNTLKSKGDCEIQRKMEELESRADRLEGKIQEIETKSDRNLGETKGSMSREESCCERYACCLRALGQSLHLDFVTSIRMS